MHRDISTFRGGTMGSAFFLGEITQIGFKLIVCVVIIHKNKRYPKLESFFWLKRSSVVGCSYCYSVFTENRRAVFCGRCSRSRPLSSPPKPTCLPPTDFLLVCRSSCSQASFCRSLHPPHPLPPHIQFRCTSLLLFSSSREALPNQKQLRQALTVD